MIYASVPHVDKPVSRIVFGTATPKMFAAFRSVYESAPDFDQRLETAFSLLDSMYALGVNCFDCADHYGEEPLGEWMEARGLRDKVVILAKGAHHNRWRKRITDFDILHDCHNTLAKLKTDHLDMYLLHRDDPAMPVGPIVDVLNRLYDEGKIGAIGASNWTLERFQEANDYALKHGLQPFSVVSPNFGLADQVNDPWGGGCVTISGSNGRAARRFYAENHIPVFAYSPLARGFFSGRLDSAHPERAAELLDEAGVKGYCCPENFERLRRCEILAKEKNVPVAQIAMAWIFSHRDLDVFALSGSTNVENQKMNIAACEYPLSVEECAWLDLECER